MDSCDTDGIRSSRARAILGPVFELTVTSSFSAAHALVIKGVREPVHGHDWNVEVVVEGDTLDEDGLLCDFHHLEAGLERTLAPFRTANLNDDPAFSEENPSAEVVARHVGRRLLPELPQGVRLARVSVTEAPGCKAAWIPRSRSEETVR